VNENNTKRCREAFPPRVEVGGTTLNISLHQLNYQSDQNLTPES